MQENKKEITKEYYNNRFGDLSQNLNEEEQIRWKILSANISAIKEIGTLKIADFGCGRGWLSHKLSEFGQVTGFDISELSVENAKKSFPHNTFMCLDASQDIPSVFCEQFDLVVSSEVIEHIDDQENYLRNIYKLLKKGGKLVITTPNGSWFNAFYCDGRDQWKQPIENWRTPEQLVSLTKKTGISKILCTTFQSEWIFALQPKVDVNSSALYRKGLKLLGLYNSKIASLNKKMYGLNILLIGEKI
ncbi:MAG: class I SAM-dependent methyltransferase [Bacteroidota bacterium]